MADEEMLLSLCASSVVAVIMMRRQKRRKNRKIWTREWLRNRIIFEAYYTLLAELRNLDISSYRNFLRMDVTSFEGLLQLVAPIITRQETNMRSTIPPGERLALTLRYLATGMVVFIENSIYNNVSLFMNPCEVLSRQTSRVCGVA